MKRWLRYPRYASLARATALALLFALPAQGAEGEGAGRRLALVVGNAQYQSVYSLRNPVNDSHAVADTLERLGFEVVSLDNAGRDDFQAAVDDFSRMAEGAEATVFYFSGHGFQLKGANYLVPTDAKLTSAASIEKETLRLDAIISELQSRNRQTLIFLDACRNNPLPENLRDKDGESGLAEIETGSGTFVAFATAPGSITRDGTGTNSPFTNALVEHMETPGISISDMMIRVRNEVEEATAHEQTPWDQSSLRSQFYFNPEGEGEDALTDEDRELLLSLDPALRKKFETRFGLKIESVEEDGDGESEELIATIVPAVTISAGGDDASDAADEAPQIVPSLIISDADDVQHGPPDIVAIPAPRPEQPDEPDFDVALLASRETPRPLDGEAPAAGAPAAGSEAPAVAVPETQPEAIADAPAAEPEVSVDDAEALAPASPETEKEAVAEAPAVEPAASVAEAPAPTAADAEAQAVAEAPAVEPVAPVAEAPAPTAADAGAQAVAEAPAVEPAAPVAEAPAPTAAEAEAEAVAEAPAIEPAAPVAEAEAPALTAAEAEAEAVAEAPAIEPAAPVAEAEAPALTAAETEAETVAEAPAVEPVASVAEAEAPAPTAAEAEAGAVAEAPTIEPAAPVAESETPAPDAPEAKPEAVAEVPAIEPAAPVAEAEAPALTAAETEAETVAEAPAVEPVAPVAEAEAPVPTAAEAEEAIAEAPAIEPAVPVAEAEAPAPAASEAKAGAVAEAPAVEPVASVAEADEPVPTTPEVVAESPALEPAVPAAAAEAPAVATAEAPPEAVAEVEQKPAPVEAEPEQTVAMLATPAPATLAAGQEASRAVPPVAEEPAAAVRQDGGPVASPDVPQLFPTENAKAEIPPAAALPAAGPVEHERQMAALSPSELRPALAPPPVEEPEAAADVPADMPRAIQEQLARLGCYRSTIDGDWGPKSAKALLRYYATKKEAPDELDPNATLLAKLTDEETVVCTRTESDRTVTRKKSDGDKGERTVKKSVKPAPAARKPAGPRTAAPAKPKPAPKIATQERKKKLSLGTGAFR